jgi:hypothetical protein
MKGHIPINKQINILPRIRGRAWLIDMDLDWMIGFIETLYNNTVRDYSNYRTIAILHTLQFTVAQSSLVVTWQRIYKSLTVTSNHTWRLLFTV